VSGVDFDPRSDHPLGTRRPDLLSTPGGVPLADITLEALRAGDLDATDMRATPDTLRRQAEVARAAGREPLAAGLERAAELARVRAETMLEIYTALRPHRSTRAQLEAWAQRLEESYEAPATAAFVREAAAVYAERALLQEDDHAEV